MPKRNNENVINKIPPKILKTENYNEKTKEKVKVPCEIESQNNEEKLKAVETTSPTTNEDRYSLTYWSNPEKSQNKEFEPVASTSNSTNEDRYCLNYWSDTETNSNDEEEKEIIKIKSLTIGQIEQKSLLIRITYKSEIKDTRSGKIVSCLLIDDTGEIALVTYGKIALNIYKNWEHNQVYSLENFEVQTENVNYPSGSNNPLQIKANQNFRYKKMDQNRVPPISFSFQPINEIKTFRRNIRVDVLGILLKDYVLEKNDNNVPLRDLWITDKKKGTIIATLWGTAAAKFNSQENSVIAIRKGVLTTFRDIIKINCTYGTLVWANPKIPETSPLLKWFSEHNKMKLQI